MVRAFLMLVCLTLPAVAQAQSCADAQNQMELTDCAYQEWQIADAELNAVYPRVMAMLKAQDAELDPITKAGPKPCATPSAPGSSSATRPARQRALPCVAARRNQ